MGCRGIESCTVTSLVGSYLVGATIGFFISKFFSFSTCTSQISSIVIGFKTGSGLGEEVEESEPGAGCGKKAISDRMKSLEMELEEERSARAALCLDLEMERSAACSAANEAMAMILRLQKEKAKIDMEARQYRRMIEEKCAYDAQEMLILEKEVQMYKQMLYGENVVQQASHDSNDHEFQEKSTVLPTQGNICSSDKICTSESSIVDVHIADDDHQVLLIKDDEHHNQNSNIDHVELMSAPRSCSDNLSRRASYFDCVDLPPFLSF